MSKKTIGQLERELKALKTLRKAQEQRAVLIAKRDSLQREVNLERRKVDPRHQKLKEIGKKLKAGGKRVGRSKTFKKAKRRFMQGPGEIF